MIDEFVNDFPKELKRFKEEHNKIYEQTSKRFLIAGELYALQRKGDAVQVYIENNEKNIYELLSPIRHEEPHLFSILCHIYTSIAEDKR